MVQPTDSIVEIFPKEEDTNPYLSSSSSTEGLLLSCKDLKYSVYTGSGRNKQKKPILRGITASFKPGRVTAVMGSSGAGKTTLLSLLAGSAGNMGSNSKGKSFISGDISLNGYKVGIEQVGKVSGFVYQDDVILPTMTVSEAVMMSARLRLPKDTSEAEIQLRCNEMMDILGIKKCGPTMVGSVDSKGISGGERKRVALAMEFMPNPSILFLDEPTSGLDTVNAYNVVALLSDLAHRTSRTIIITIHQPPSEVFHMLDDLLLLADGQVVYHGVAAEAVNYFARLGYPCPMYTNPADFFFLELLGNIKKRSDPNGGNDLSIVENLCTAWSNSSEYSKLVSYQDLDSSVELSSAKLDISQHHKESSSFARQFGFLLKRAGLNILRDRMILRAKAMQTIVIGLLIGLVYYQIGSAKEFTVSKGRDLSGALYFIVLNQFMSSSMGILSIFSKEKLVFLREHNLGYYKLAAYFFSKIVVELPYQVFFPIFMVCIVYYMIGLRSDFEYIAKLAMISVLTALNGMAMGTLAASVFNTVEIALIVLPLILIPMMIFSGLLINNKNIPWYFVWIRWISPTQYAFTASMKNQFTGTAEGDIILQQFSMDDGLNIWENTLALLVSYVTLMGLAYLALFIISRRK